MKIGGLMTFKIEFHKAGQIMEWDGSAENILDFAEEKGIQIESSCRIGVCGTCKLKLISGEVSMTTEDGLTEEDKRNHFFLPCVAIPESDLIIDG